MKIAYLSCPSENKMNSAVLVRKLRDIGWVVLDPFEQKTTYGDVVDLDLQMIDKVDYVIIYYPVKTFSFGVPIETYYAYKHEKELYMLSTDEIMAYPFVQKYIPKSHQYISEEKLLRNLAYIK